MKIQQIRNGVFETNSSSTHSIVIGTEEEFNKWERGELICYTGVSPNELITKEEQVTIALRDKNEGYEEDTQDFLTFQDWGEDKEEYVERFKHKGETLIIRMGYGYN